MKQNYLYSVQWVVVYSNALSIIMDQLMQLSKLYSTKYNFQKVEENGDDKNVLSFMLPIKVIVPDYILLKQ